MLSKKTVNLEYHYQTEAGKTYGEELIWQLQLAGGIRDIYQVWLAGQKTLRNHRESLPAVKLKVSAANL